METEKIISAQEALVNSEFNKGKISDALNKLIKKYSDVGLTSFRISARTKKLDYEFVKLQIPMLEKLGYKVEIIPTAIVSNSTKLQYSHSEDMKISWGSEK